MNSCGDPPSDFLAWFWVDHFSTGFDCDSVDVFASSPLLAVALSLYAWRGPAWGQIEIWVLRQVSMPMLWALQETSLCSQIWCNMFAFKPISKGAYCKWPYIGFRIRCMPNKAKELSRLGIAHPELAKNQPARKKDEGSFRVLQRLSNVAGFDR